MALRPEQVFTRDSEGQDHVDLGKFVVREVIFFGTHHRCVGAHAGSGLVLIVRLLQHRGARPGEVLPIFANREDLVVLAG